MKKQIIRFSPFQNAKVLAVLYFVISIPFALLMMLMPTPPGAGWMRMFYIAMPIVYLVVGFIFALIGCWVYNLVAPYVGGFEFTSTEVANGDPIA